MATRTLNLLHPTTEPVARGWRVIIPTAWHLSTSELRMFHQSVFDDTQPVSVKRREETVTVEIVADAPIVKVMQFVEMCRERKRGE